jgi:hypothetical protein
MENKTSRAICHRRSERQRIAWLATQGKVARRSCEHGYSALRRIYAATFFLPLPRTTLPVNSRQQNALEGGPFIINRQRFADRVGSDCRANNNQ